MLKIAYSPIYVLPLPPGHRFPMEKYELIPQQLLFEGTVTPDNFFVPTLVEDAVIHWTHSPNYLQRLKTLSLDKQEVRRIGFPLSQWLIEREFLITSGTVECALYALQYGAAMNVAGGTHHAFRDKAEGFCILNDIAVAANYLLHRKLAKQIIIIDLDVHQGNGTAALFEHMPQVFTFSMHGANNFPYKKEKSDLDISLADGTTDEIYLENLEKILEPLLEKVQPDFVFYLSGVDVLATDKLGRLNLSIAGCKQRDRLVLEAIKKRNLPIVIVMGGGYSPKINDIVQAHCNTYRLVQEIFF
ncbi:MAG: histone deacetylase [Bacteroidia bacterium]|nr:histone deacetylase [Bacteroidia bacterium]MDW8157724.1 histone deacetylase [Bacteroidia bacterium]